eukprot:CAMPEP_0113623972 /NCGR_PEP_ID=MMETSP0017_2-20120614/12350_1 /TAXON_ID=2856 /ORGANISM="Cylindrotheca closterium" /LENGTH=384 /DNA_ID=CAMNT_0000533973 /DNA_START=36 /DNA_END=1190 /DNA_ORIENTATION=+ /assembly_acc=CAM_ASM_000147
MRLSKLMPSRYLIPSTSKYYFTKRRRSKLNEEQEQQLQQEQRYQEQQEQEQALLEETIQSEEECEATLYNVEMVAQEDQSTLVFEEEREAMTGEAEDSQEVREESPTQRQDIEDIRKYGLAAECREKASDEERDQEMQLRKVANKKAHKISEEENDYGPSFIDTLCFSSKAVADTTEEYQKEDDASQTIKLDQDDSPRPFDRLVGGYIYKNHKDDKIGMSIKDSKSKQGVYISGLHIGSRFKWSTDVSVDGMRILSINGLACPSDLEATVDMMKQAEGDLKLIAAAIDPPKLIALLDDDEDTLADCDQEEDEQESESEVSSGSGDHVSALTFEKDQASQTSSEGSSQDGDNKEQQQEKTSEDADTSQSTSVLALARERSTVQYI